MVNRTLLEQTALDRDLFFDTTSGLAETITLDGATGEGIYQAEPIITGDDFEAVAPVVHIWGADFPNVAQGSTLIVRSTTYKVTSVLADSFGVTRLSLRLAN